MFGIKKAARPIPASSEIGLLGVGTRFRGTVRFRGMLRLDGRVEGDIRSEQGSGSVLVINSSAEVHGSIVSDTVMLSGRVEGNIIAQQRVEIFRHGVLKGDLYTNEIMIEGGASFQGQCHMIRDLDADQQKALAEQVGRERPAPGGLPPAGEPRDDLDKQYTA